MSSAHCIPPTAPSLPPPETASPFEAMAQFQRRMGKSALSSADAVWIGETRLSLLAAPCDLELRPDLAQLQGLLRRSGRAAAIFRCAPGTGRAVGHCWVVRERDYGLHSLQRQFRQQLKIALSKVSCRPMAWAELATAALALNQDAARRRAMCAPRFTRAELWSEYCEAAAQVPGHEIMGAFVGGELAAYMITWQAGSLCHGLHMAWSDRFQAVHPSHALYFEITRTRMAQADIAGFSVGRSARLGPDKVDAFKRHAGFQAEPCHEGVVLHPALAPVICHRWSQSGLRLLRHAARGRWPRLDHAEVFEIAGETRLE